MAKDYLQIPKWRCAGNKELLNKIQDTLKNDKNFRFNDDGNIFLIEYIKKTEKPNQINIEHGAGWRG